MKLSKTMQQKYDALLASDWYYQYNGRSCSDFATDKGYRCNGAGGTGIVKGGYVYSRMSSSTLNALAKRGLIEIILDGKSNLDVIKVIGMELPERIEKCLKVNLQRTDSAHPERKPMKLTGYATSEKAIEHLANHFKGVNNYFDVEIISIQEIELEVWDVLN